MESNINVKLESQIFIVEWTEDREVTEEDLNILVNQEAQNELEFFQKQKVGDSDRWDDSTPRLDACDDFKFWASESCGEPTIWFKGLIKDPQRIKQFLSKKPKRLPIRPN